MIHSKKLTLGICLVLLIILIGGYVIMTKTNGRNAQIKDTFNQTLKLYPTKNLDDFTIKKAFEIKNLIKEIKGLGLLILE
ncbi:Membrane lipoprotein [Staphylococcus aureus]|uniref:Membrane lipoprotein n=1 Tax=Staphylococcus aureus TaxID=1280 RepID=A0A380DX88_STAAU|nr:Membrane lipoprotein [Staphylococcus aureus]